MLSVGLVGVVVTGSGPVVGDFLHGLGPRPVGLPHLLEQGLFVPWAADPKEWAGVVPKNECPASKQSPVQNDQHFKRLVHNFV